MMPAIVTVTGHMSTLWTPQHASQLSHPHDTWPLVSILQA